MERGREPSTWYRDSRGWFTKRPEALNNIDNNRNMRAEQYSATPRLRRDKEERIGAPQHKSRSSTKSSHPTPSWAPSHGYSQTKIFVMEPQTLPQRVNLEYNPPRNMWSPTQRTPHPTGESSDRKHSVVWSTTEGIALWDAVNESHRQANEALRQGRRVIDKAKRAFAQAKKASIEA